MDKRDPRFNDLITELTSDIDLLYYAYSNIKSKPGNMSPGPDGTTLDGISEDFFKKTQKALATGAFKFKPARIVEIPKPNGKTRALGVASPLDKIVQELMRLILEAVYLKEFSPHSHGFIPGKSCHTALKDLKGRFGFINWFIEADIKSCFDSFDHKLLIGKVNADIKSQLFMDLLYKALKVGYVDIVFFCTQRSLDVGTPQGSIISPTLCNIYLNELDNYIEELMTRFNKGSRRAANPEYTKLMRPRTVEERLEARRAIRDGKIRARKSHDPNFKRLRYVRYADDFIMGVIGSKQDAKDILNEVGNFLQERLHLSISLEKTKITHATTDKARFLGVDIGITPDNKNPLRRINYKGGEKITVKGSTRPQLLAPIPTIVSKLKSKGYVSKKGKPCRVGRLIHYTPAMIVEHYLSIGRGLINYYSFVNNYAITRARILYILKYSCALTLCTKLRLRTLHKTFAKFGYNLDMRNDKGEIIRNFDEAKFPRSSQGFKTANYNPLSVIDHAVKAVPRTRKSFEDSSCTVCGSTQQVEMHHLKHIKKRTSVKELDYLTKIMIQMNRKQIPMCANCHRDVHKGAYDKAKLSTLNNKLNQNLQNLFPSDTR